jgi:periplasmic divalent cation tolerance protein
MVQAGLIVVLVTASTEDEAEKIASVLLETRKAACVNIIPKVTSHFWWQGKIDTADETLLIIKTRASALPEVIELVKRNHSYSVPEIIALPVTAGNPDYLDWMGGEVKE